MERDVRTSLGEANRALETVWNALAVYQHHCAAFRWDEAEKERVRLIGSMESFLDSFAAANRRIEIERGQA